MAAAVSGQNKTIDPLIVNVDGCMLRKWLVCTNQLTIHPNTHVFLFVPFQGQALSSMRKKMAQQDASATLDSLYAIVNRELLPLGKTLQAICFSTFFCTAHPLNRIVRLSTGKSPMTLVVHNGEIRTTMRELLTMLIRNSVKEKPINFSLKPKQKLTLQLSSEDAASLKDRSVDALIFFYEHLETHLPVGYRYKIALTPLTCCVVPDPKTETAQLTLCGDEGFALTLTPTSAEKAEQKQ